MTDVQTETTKSSHKQAAMSFLRLASTGGVKEAFSTYVGPNFKHHNPYFHGDAKSLARGMEDNAAANPGKVFEVKHALEDGDLVVVHSRMQLLEAGPVVAVIHIFRFEGDLIAELWDVGQTVPEDSPNVNGMF